MSDMSDYSPNKNSWRVSDAFSEWAGIKLNCVLNIY